MAGLIRQRELRSLVRRVCHAASVRRAAPSFSDCGCPVQQLQRKALTSSCGSGEMILHSQDTRLPVIDSRFVEAYIRSRRSHGLFFHRAKAEFSTRKLEDEAVATSITETVSVSPEASSNVVTLDTEIEASSQSMLPDGSSPLPNVAKMPKLDPGREIQPGRVYIAGLPLGLKGDEVKKVLQDLCSEHGTVSEITLGQHRHMSPRAIEAGKHRGFAFVTMENSEQARVVIDKVHGATAFDGRTLRASFGLREKPFAKRPKIDKKNKLYLRIVYVGNLHKSTTDEDLALHFQELGTIEQVNVLTELHTDQSRGFGFVTFEKEEQARRAVQDRNGSSLDGSSIVVNIAKYPPGY